MSQSITEDISSGTKDALRQSAPWRQGIPWWVVGLEGLLALGLGLYILVRQGAAGIQAVQFLGIFLLLISIVGAVRGIRGSVNRKALPYHMLAAGVGLATGTIIACDIWQDFMTPTAALVIISIGLLLYGLVGLLEWLLSGKTGRTWFGLGVAVVTLLIGLLVLWSRLTLAAYALQLTGVVATLAGVALIGYAVLLYRRQAQSGSEAAPAPGEPAAETAGVGGNAQGEVHNE